MSDEVKGGENLNLFIKQIWCRWRPLDLICRLQYFASFDFTLSSGKSERL